MEKFSDTNLRATWRMVGGSFHGPKIETGTMPEAALLPYLRRIYTAISISRDALIDIAMEPCKTAHGDPKCKCESCQALAALDLMNQLNR